MKSLSLISQSLGVAPLLPGENVDLYESGLLATIQELEAKTPLQIYLAEKIFDCLWWIRRYEEQKRGMVLNEIATIVVGQGRGNSALANFKKWVLDELYANSLSDELLELIASADHSVQSLRQFAVSRCVGKLSNLM